MRALLGGRELEGVILVGLFAEEEEEVGGLKIFG